MAIMKIVLPIDEHEALQALAQRELRDPRAQALLLIRDGLQRQGLLLNEVNAATFQVTTLEKEKPVAAATPEGGNHEHV